MKDNNIVEKASDYAIRCHSAANHLYDGQPYIRHLQHVYDIAKKYSHHVSELHRANVLAAAWTHDVIEDARQTYNDVMAATNMNVAELTYALTNDKGKTRSQRAGDKYYYEMSLVPHACFLKICDRIANMQYSIEKKSRMAGKYADEMPSFILSALAYKYPDMLRELTELQEAAKHIPIEQ
jgi:(p)ppGpp synthase/HD superfamily hydrolase